MDFCILRIEKLNSFGSIAASAKHTFREIDTPNADPARTHLNVTSGARNAAEVCDRVRARLPAKRRSDAVLCLEYLVSASSNWFSGKSMAQHMSYFDEAMAWLVARHGADNVVCSNIQFDESTPHLVVYAVPLTTDGRLCAKHFIGNRAQLSALQTAFHEAVGQPHGLSRGVQGSKASHITNKKFHSALAQNPLLRPPEPPKLAPADWQSGRAAELFELYGKELEEFATVLEQTRRVALLHPNVRRIAAGANDTTQAEVDRLMVERKTLEETMRRSAAEVAELQKQAEALDKNLKTERARMAAKLVAEAERLHRPGRPVKCLD